MKAYPEVLGLVIITKQVYNQQTAQIKNMKHCYMFRLLSLAHLQGVF
jgi:hypothetical protein